MNKNTYLHNVISCTIYIAYYYSASFVANTLKPTFDVIVEQSVGYRIGVLAFLFVLFFIIPVLLYSFLKRKLLIEFGMHPLSYSSFVKQNMQLFMFAAVLFVVWDIIGAGFYDPTTQATAIILILYGILLAAGLLVFVTFMQYTHQAKTFTHGYHAFWKHPRSLFLLAGLFSISVALSWGLQTLLMAYTITDPLANTTIVLLALGILAAYTIWQERVYALK